MALEVVDTKRYTEPLGRPSDKKREEATAFFTEKIRGTHVTEDTTLSN